MSTLLQSLEHKLDLRKASGKLRALSIPPQRVDFFSNDYLGLATERKLVSDTDGTGSTGARLLSGNSLLAEEIETIIAGHHHAEAALLFNSGYDANIGLLSSIADKHTTILYDELCHASIIDGIRLSLCIQHYKFRHNDLLHLEEKLKKVAHTGPIIIVVESVYSMDGDICPLKEIASLAATYNASLIVDEAHATGVFGAHGEGLVSSLNLQDLVTARVHTYGKAMGCHGAAVVGSSVLKQYLINFARSFIYTTALPPSSLQSIAKAYTYVQVDDFSNQPLHELIQYFRERIVSNGITGWINSISAIQAIVVGDNTKALLLANTLQQAGYQINAILHPTVPEGKERLRICLHTFNTTQQIDDIIAIIKKNL